MASLARYIDIHTHGTPKDDTIALVSLFPEQGIESGSKHHFYGSGIHPWYLESQMQYWENLVELLKQPRFIAVGECGLDVFASSTLKCQENVFRKQVQLSESLNKPIVIHCVRVYNEIIRIRKEMKAVQPWILHGFHGNDMILKQCMNHGIYISFGRKNLLHSGKLNFKALNSEFVFLETDTDSLPIEETYELFGKVYGASVIEMKEVIERNFVKVFPKITDF